MDDDGLKDFARVGGRLIHGALADGSDLDQVLLGIQEDDAKRFAIPGSAFRNKGPRLLEGYRW
jgi:hypothetical protein